MRAHVSKVPVVFAVLTSVSAVILAGLFALGRTSASTPVPVAPARSSHIGSSPQLDWGELVTGTATTYDIYAKDTIYGSTPFLITDMRPDDVDAGKIYSDKQSYEIRSLTLYRAHDGQAFLEHQPVVFFVHGGAWTDGYRDWYRFVARPFTGEKGWVTVVIDYRLTSEQVYIADQHCPDRETCVESEATKAAWYPDNIDDVAAAFQWTVDHIADNGGDARKIVVFGHSAGGHLVSLLATSTAPDHQPVPRTAIRGVVSMSGAYDLNSINHLFWNSALTQTFPDGCNDPALLAQASPVTYVVSDTVKSPFYLLYAEDELINLTEQNLAFGKQIEALGFDTTISYLPGYGHSSEMTAIAEIDETPTALIVDWIEGVLRENAYLPWVVR